MIQQTLPPTSGHLLWDQLKIKPVLLLTPTTVPVIWALLLILMWERTTFASLATLKFSHLLWPPSSQETFSWMGWAASHPAPAVLVLVIHTLSSIYIGTATTDNIDMRTCAGAAMDYAKVALKQIEIYVK